jgi:hypothetical protein
MHDDLEQSLPGYGVECRRTVSLNRANVAQIVHSFSGSGVVAGQLLSRDVTAQGAAEVAGGAYRPNRLSRPRKEVRAVREGRLSALAPVAWGPVALHCALWAPAGAFGQLVLQFILLWWSGCRRYKGVYVRRTQSQIC